MSAPERIWLRVTGDREWTIADHDGGPEFKREYIRADLHPTYAAQAVCEAVLYMYGPSGTWVGEEMRKAGEDPYPRLWRLVQLAVNAPRPNGRWAPYEGLMRELASAMTGRSVDEVTQPLSEVLHRLRYRPDPAEHLCEECGNNLHHCETNGCAMENYYRTETPGMVVTELEAWEYEGEDGG